MASWRSVDVIILAALSAIAASILSWVIESPLLKYPLITVAIGSVLFIIKNNISRLYFSVMSSKKTDLTDILIFLGISAITIHSMNTPLGVPRLFYILTIGITILLSARIVLGSVHPVIALLEIILLGIAIRVSFYYSYPIYGQDQFHLGAVKYILREGSIIPEEFTYYREYPITHILAASISKFTSIGSKQGLFVAGGVIQVLSYSGLYFISRMIGYRNRSALLVMLVPTVSGASLNIGSEIFAQTLAGAIFIFIFWIYLYSNDNLRLIGCLLVLCLSGFLSHHLIAALIIGTSGLIWLTHTSISKLHSIGVGFKNQLPTPLFGVALIMFIGSVYYWILTDYLSYQSSRIITIFSFSTGHGSEAIDSSSSTAPSVVFVDGLLPPAIQWAGPMLVIVLISTITGFTFLLELSKQVQNHSKAASQYTIIALMIFGGFSAIYAIGGQGPLSRVFHAVTVLTAPLMAYTVDIDYNKYVAWSDTILVIILAACIVTAGILSPAVAMSDRTEEDFSPTGSHQDIAAIHFVDTYSSNPVSDGYLSSASLWYGSNLGSQQIDRVLTHTDRDKFNNYYKAIEEGDHIVYRSLFKDRYGINEPKLGKIYTNKNVSIYSLKAGSPSITK